MKLLLALIAVFLFFTAPAFSELTSETDKRSINEIGQWEKHADQLFILVMGLLAAIAFLFIVSQIVGEIHRKERDILYERIEKLQQEIETLKQERVVRP